MEKLQLPKGNMMFTEDPKVLEFIEYCKEKYSQDIRNIDLKLYDEVDAAGDEWLMTVSETSKNKDQGHVWVPWHIPTTKATIVEGNMAPMLKKPMSKDELIEAIKDKYGMSLNDIWWEDLDTDDPMVMCDPDSPDDKDFWQFCWDSGYRGTY